MQLGSWLAVLLASATLVGCESFGSLLETDKIDYRSATQRHTLDVPPELARLDNSQNYTVPGAPTSASEYQQARQGANSSRETFVSNNMGDITMQRDGNRRWLVVERTPEQLWTTVEAFWQDIGFVLVLDEPKLGIMETDWAENRAKIPQDIIRRTIGGIFDGLYSTGERDKFRTRMEVTPTGTEIYITHRGVEEVYGDNDKSTTVWQPRPVDPELEAEMLRRLMVRLGVSEEASQQIVTQTPSTPTRAHLVKVAGQPAVRLDEQFDDAWRWVGVSLDRLSFTVVQRDRMAGTYQVRYIDPVVDTRETEKGLFSGWFGSGSSSTQQARNYIIKLNADPQNANSTLIQMYDKDGKPVSPQVATRIANALIKDLN